MLELTVLGDEYWDENTEQFVRTPSETLLLEHSLVSLSKWESKWEKPFTNTADHSDEETLDYVKCMLIAPISSLDILYKLTEENQKEIDKYINAKMTATFFAETPTAPGVAPKKEIVTAEVVYYWMTALGIPTEYQYWHLNRLFTLIKVANAKNQPPEKKKPFTRDALEARRALNEQRKREAQTRG